MKTSELIGKEVLDADAIKIGKVADVDIDIQKGIVNHIVVKVGLIKKYVVTLERIDRIGDKVLLRIKGAELK